MAHEEPRLAERVKQLRLARSWTLEKLAAEAALSYPTVRRIEGGQYPRVEHLIKLADVLGVSLDYLVGRSDDA